MIDTIRLTEQTKRDFLKLKRRTGISHWNVLSRWAFCLAANSVIHSPTDKAPKMSNVELTWKTFTGAQQYEYRALLGFCYDTQVKIQNETTQTDFLQSKIEIGAAILVAQCFSLADFLDQQDGSKKLSRIQGSSNQVF